MANRSLPDLQKGNDKETKMKLIPEKLHAFCLRFVQIISLLLTGVLLISGVLLTCYSTDMETQKVLTKWDNLLFTLPATTLLCLLLFLVAAQICQGPKVSRLSGSRLAASWKLKSSCTFAHRLLRLFVLCWCVTMGIVLILFGKTVPAADAWSVYSIAEHLASGDTSVIHPTDSYLSYYPQQIGLVAFYEPLIRIWKLTRLDLQAYHFIKVIYVLLGCVIILFQEKIVHALWKDERTDCLYLLLAGANCPLLMYTSFVYGEIPSFAAISVGFYLLILLLTKKDIPEQKKAVPISRSSLLLALGSLFFVTLSVLLRKNSLIFVIGAVLVILLEGLCHQKRPAMLLLTALYIACALAILPCVQKFYENRSGSTIASGVPAITYFAMGMQEASRANGWYNGFNFNTYHDTGMDTAATTAISREAIRERLAYFQKEPRYALRFYLQKYLSQWADGTYACRQATLATFGGRSDFFVSLYEGSYSQFLISYCNLYQNILYLGAFWFCFTPLFRQKCSKPAGTPQQAPEAISDFPPAPKAACPRSPFESDALPAYLGLICALGGFLFHMLWEGNSRYILLYGLAILPCAARGLSELLHPFNNTLRRRKSAQNSEARR